MPSITSAPPRFQDKTLGTITAIPGIRAALAAAKRFAAGEHRNLVITGPTGVGKTHLAVGAAAARYAHDQEVWDGSEDAAEFKRQVEKAAPWERPRPKNQPHPPEWQNVVDLIVGLREDMNLPLDEKAWHTRPSELRTWPGVVVLDDLGREKVSDWTGETIYGLVNNRYEWLMPTIVTTNLSGAELAASPYWPAISRLAEDGALVRIEAPDHRLSRADPPKVSA